jgi:hypothetical protein
MSPDNSQLANHGIGRFPDGSADFPESHLPQAASQLACGHTRPVEAAMDEDAWMRIWSLVVFIWTVFSIIFPIIVLAALYSLNKTLEALSRKHDQTANQIAELANVVTQSLPKPAPVQTASFEQPPVPAIVAGSALEQILADPETRKVAGSMRRVYGLPVAVDVVKRRAVELGLGDVEVTEDELDAALQSESVEAPPSG